MSLLQNMTRYRGRFLRVVLFLMGGTLCVHATASLVSGEPDYLNFFRQRVAAPVALAVGLALLVASAVPWRRLRSPSSWPASWSTEPPASPAGHDAPPGRNDLCPCGSGRKYKRCCLSKHRLLARERRTHDAAAALNRSSAVSGGTHMANRGLSGR